MKRRASIEPPTSTILRRARPESQPIIHDLTALPRRSADVASIAEITLDVHNVVMPQRRYPSAVALSVWTDRIKRVIELETIHRSYDILSFVRHAILVLAGERQTGRGPCAERYQAGQADLWEIIMNPRETGGAGNCLAYTNAIAAMADEFGLFGIKIRMATSAQHAFLLAHSHDSDPWRIIEATSVQSSNVVFEDNINETPSYAVGEYGVIATANEFRFLMLDQGWMHLQSNVREYESKEQEARAAEEARVASMSAAEVARRATEFERLIEYTERDISLEQSRRRIEQMVAQAQLYAVRTLPASDIHYGKFWWDKIIVIAHHMVPLEEGGPASLGIVVTRLSPGYITAVRRTIRSLLVNQLVLGFYNHIEVLLRDLISLIKVELGHEESDQRLFELDQATRVINWALHELNIYLKPPEVVLEWSPLASIQVGGGSMQTYVSGRSKIEFMRSIWKRFDNFRLKIWSPVAEFVSAILVGWTDPKEPLLLYNRQRRNSR